VAGVLNLNPGRREAVRRREFTQDGHGPGGDGGGGERSAIHAGAGKGHKQGAGPHTARIVFNLSDIEGAPLREEEALERNALDQFGERHWRTENSILIRSPEARMAPGAGC
jgi:hypothetical protein